MCEFSGKKNKVDPSLYKANFYHECNPTTYYDIEVELTKYRLPQPDPKKKDDERKTDPNAPPMKKLSWKTDFLVV